MMAVGSRMFLFVFFHLAHAAPLTAFATTQVAMEQIVHPLKPTARWDSSLLSKPKPTGAWWENVVLRAGEQTIATLPYYVQMRDYGMEFGYSGNNLINTNEYVFGSFRSAFFFATNGDALGKGRVVGYDLLSMTFEYPAGSGSIRIPLIRGSPYLTTIYSQVSPCLETVNAIISVNGRATSPVTGSSFTIELNNGETWVVYASSSQTWTWSVNRLCTTHKAASFTIRVAYVADSTSLITLNAHAATYALGGAVDIDVQGANAVVKFDYTVKTWSRSENDARRSRASEVSRDMKKAKSGNAGLLLMSLPHHAATLQNPAGPNITFRTVTGAMKAVEGSRWTFNIPLVQMSWDAPRPIDADKLEDVKGALLKDVQTLSFGSTDPYFWGKQMSRAARLALIADAVGDTNSRETCLVALVAQFDSWVKGTNTDKLQYDTTWNGIVPKNGVADEGADFGAGYYNDHHYHYGYHLYAAAVVTKFRPEWAGSTVDYFTALARDIANPVTEDPFFPQFRHFDWFEGHSWASGLFEFGDGKNQESSSEAVNGWYALQLYGEAISDSNMVNAGRLLLSMELHSARTYFHMSVAEGSVYDPPYSNNKCVGILWNCKSVYTTWFAAGAVYIHGIQMLPFVPVTELLLTKPWITEEYPVVEEDMGKHVYPMGWVGFMYMANAVIDKAAAWTQVKSLTAFDDGNSQTNAFWWVATRPTDK